VPIRIAAVVLAAGMSRRMGRPKALLPLAGLPLIVRVVEPIISVDSIEPIVVVTGHHADQVTRAMDGCDVQFAHNPEYAVGGMLSSVKTGVRAVANHCDAFFLVLGDQPLVRAETYREMQSRWREATAETPWCVDRGFAPSRMIQPTFDGCHGHPILLSSDSIDAILALPPDATLKDYTHHISKLEVPVDDPGILADIDTPEDYDRAVEQFQAHRSEPCSK
jgi:molybdenum cofactor cytidylyltransferase